MTSLLAESLPAKPTLQLVSQLDIVPRVYTKPGLRGELSEILGHGILARCSGIIEQFRPYLYCEVASQRLVSRGIDSNILFGMGSYNSSPQSRQALALIRSAISSPYPPTDKTSKVKATKPLTFDLNAVENQPPTPDQIRSILSYLKVPVNTLVSSHPLASTAATPPPDSPKALYEASLRNPHVFRYPVVCNWDSGEAALSVDGVKKMLDNMAKIRDDGVEVDVVPPRGWFF